MLDHATATSNTKFPPEFGLTEVSGHTLSCPHLKSFMNTPPCLRLVVSGSRAAVHIDASRCNGTCRGHGLMNDEYAIQAGEMDADFPADHPWEVALDVVFRWLTVDETEAALGWERAETWVITGDLAVFEGLVHA